MTDIPELLERVRKATGPDRHLDAMIEVEARRQEAYLVGLSDEQRAKWKAGINGVVTDGHTTYFAYTFTASTDAALALSKRMAGDNWFSVLVDATRDFGAAGTLGPEHLARYIVLHLLLSLSQTERGGEVLAWEVEDEGDGRYGKLGCRW